MKKKMCMFLIAGMALMMTACGGADKSNTTASESASSVEVTSEAESTSGTTDVEDASLEETKDMDVAKEVQDWIDTVENAESFSDVKDYFDTDSEDTELAFENLKGLGDVKVTSAESIGQVSGKEVVKYAYESENAGEGFTCYLFGISDDGHYVVCSDQNIINEASEQFACSECGGSGSVVAGNAVVCSTCGGSGQQYMDNLYYDQINGWTGGYVACSGCGGSGYTSGVTVCGICGGYGVR